MKNLLKVGFITIVAMAIIAGTISIIWGYEVADKFRYGFLAVFAIIMGWTYYKNRP